MNTNKISFFGKNVGVKTGSQQNNINNYSSESFAKILSDKQIETETEYMACKKKSSPVGKYALPEYMYPDNRIIEAPVVKYAMPQIRNVDKPKDEDLVEKYAVPNEPDPIDPEDK